MNTKSKDGILPSFDEGHVTWKGILLIEYQYYHSSIRTVYMGAGAPAKKKKCSLARVNFFRGKVRLFPYLAERFNGTTRRKEKKNATDK